MINSKLWYCHIMFGVLEDIEIQFDFKGSLRHLISFLTSIHFVLQCWLLCQNTTNLPQGHCFYTAEITCVMYLYVYAHSVPTVVWLRGKWLCIIYNCPLRAISFFFSHCILFHSTGFFSTSSSPFTESQGERRKGKGRHQRGEKRKGEAEELKSGRNCPY